MNQFDASATPMFDCFSAQANVQPFAALPTNIPLDQMNAGTGDIHDPILREDAIVSASIDFSEVDHAPEDLLNRILWRAMKGTKVPFPEWASSEPSERRNEGE